MTIIYQRCPKCGHQPLPAEQAFPCACPGCGVIFAKIGQPVARSARAEQLTEESPGRWYHLLLRTPERVDQTGFWARALLLAAIVVGSVALVRMDYRSGEIGASFLHRPLLIFHEAGHVVFMPFGEWLMMLGGTLGQLLMPLLLALALLLKSRDPYGAAIGIWFLGVSLLDVAPYMYDALEPQLTLLGGGTGEDGPHDWIYLFRSVGWLARSQSIGAMTHSIGVLVCIAAIGWAAWLLRLQYRRLSGDVLHED